MTHVGAPIDPNGNLGSDGLTSYEWNARDQLASLNSGTTSTFAYDAVARRRGKTISGTTTSFLYDGNNFVQELTGSVPTANLMTGLGLDEVFTRTDAAGFSALLADALGSTLGLADEFGAVQTQYTSDAFGATMPIGAASANSLEFSGREHDGTGLYYYRARYYDSSVGRFISEDPIGFEGGINVYAYSLDNPINLNDPTGRSAAAITWPAGGLLCFGSGVCETVAIGAGAILTGAVAADLIYRWWYKSRRRGDSDPIPYPGIRKPGPCQKEPGKCNPCPPDSPYWDQPGNAHGSTSGVHYHWYHFNQKPFPDCECYPVRMDGPTPPTGGTPWSPGGQAWP